MKREKKVIAGLNFGDYGFRPDRLLEDVRKYGDGDTFRWAPVRCDEGEISEELWCEYARYFRDRKIYFSIHDAQHALAPGQKIHLSRKMAEKIQEIGGEYFLGVIVNEFGGYYATRAKGYRRWYDEHTLNHMPQGINPVQGFRTVQEAKDTYIEKLRECIDVNREVGIEKNAVVEATTLLEYDFEAGIDFPIVELMPRNMEQILNFARGAIRAYGREEFAVWLAHEFYGGYQAFDPLKAKRLPLGYLASYIGGADFVMLESGFHEIWSHGVHLPEEHPLAQSYLTESRKFADFCRRDERPAKGPIAKVAFVKGNLDGFGWGNSSSLWGQYYDEQWGFSTPEYSWRILDEVYKTLPWHDPKNVGEQDFSHAPAYGQYDVVPAGAPAEVLAQYDWLIFAGWNTMTEELLAKLKDYTRQGGNVLITAAHLKDSVERGKAGEYVSKSDLEEYLGITFTGETMRTNDGFKFDWESIIDGIVYPGPPGMACDPAWSAGYVNYEEIVPDTAKTVCYLADSFRNDPEFMYPIITENRYGKGNVVFMANLDYPGDPAVFPLYKIVVKEILAATHRISDIKVVCGEKVRFAVFEGDMKYKIYLLNTDFNFEQKVRVIYGETIIEKTVPSVGIETVELNIN